MMDEELLHKEAVLVSRNTVNIVQEVFSLILGDFFSRKTSSSREKGETREREREGQDATLSPCDHEKIHVTFTCQFS